MTLALGFGFFLSGLASSYLGSLLGLGGGFILVPVLSLIFELNIREAAGCALAAVIATSTGSSIRFLKQNLVQLELASFLEIASIFGALAGFYIAGIINPKYVFFIFSAALITSSLSMIFTKNQVRLEPRHHKNAFNFDNDFLNETGTPQRFQSKNHMLGLFFSFFAGIASALLGIGGGVIQIPSMQLVMGIPPKLAFATSSVMISLTAALSVSMMLVQKMIPLKIAAIICLGAFLGSGLGAKKLLTSSHRMLNVLFLVLALGLAIQMFFKGASL